MKLGEINQKIKELKLPEDQKDNIIELIDIKIESDMDKAITRFEAAISSLKAETNAAIGSLNSKIDASNSKIDNMKWFIGAVVAIAVGLAKIVKMF